MNALSSRAKILALEAELKKQTPEQLAAFTAAIETSHFYADGMYCRVVKRRKNVLIVGKVHKREHFYVVTAGRIAVTNGDEEKAEIYRAGAVIVSAAGTKRATLALDAGTICMTVHRTDKTDLDEIEAELIEEDPTALFDARNMLKGQTMKTIEVTP